MPSVDYSFVRPMSDPGSADRRLLEAHPTSVGIARRSVRNVLKLARRDDLVEAAELLVSEVVTNALVHAGTAIDFHASAGMAGLRVEVTDGSTQMPAPRGYGAMAGTGRGLKLLEELGDRWGALPHENGKTVWFVLTSGHPLEPGTAPVADHEAEAMGSSAAPGKDVVDVVLRNVPLLLHAAWQQHAEELLREYLLVALETDDATQVLERHAAASSAISLIHDHVPAPELGDDPEALMASAVEPGVSRDHLVLPVSRTAVPHFRVLNELLESALAMGESGALLTPPIQPEMRGFRRWLCKEVARQDHGEPPIAWSYDAGAAPPSVPLPTSWERAVGEVSEQEFIAVDDTDQIVAVGQDVCDLLGYQEPNQLVGRRLVAIIPHRYHQAHLAGFTLHLSTGRSPLLDRPVIVPALRRDGTEISVELVVEARQISAGRRLFIAHMRPAERSLEA